MSNLNEEDIAEYYVKEYQKGPYEIRLLTIPVFDQETGEEIKTDEKYHVCNKTKSSENYPCYDKRTAIELCGRLNELMKCELDEELPAQANVDSLTRLHGGLFGDLAFNINEKNKLIEKIQTAKNHELICKTDYVHKCNHIKLHPEIVKEELELTKNPTEKQIAAYCEEKYCSEFDLYNVAKVNTSLLNTKLDLINDYISLEKYIVRMMLK